MKTSRGSVFVFVLVVLSALCGYAVDGPEMGPVRSRVDGAFNFAFMPKAFQKNPDLEMTVVSEVTEYGRTFPEPSAAVPVYYALHEGGRQDRGEIVGESIVLDAGFFTPMVKKALAARHFVSTETVPGSRPALQLVYFWGSAYRMDDEMRLLFPELARKQFVERAQLVRGRRYAAELTRRLEFGGLPSDMSAKNEHLDDQAIDSLYYVVVSAYDYAALAKGERKLVWRANLTVNASGVSLAESLPPLILTAGEFLGRDMNSPEVLLRSVRRGQVSFGDFEVLESGVPATDTPKK